MNGFVDDVGRALLNIDVRPDSARQAEVISAWVDTGFTGELVLPQKTVDALALVRSGSVDAILADGSQIELNTYTCFVNWFDEERRLEVVANSAITRYWVWGYFSGLNCSSITKRLS